MKKPITHTTLEIIKKIKKEQPGSFYSIEIVSKDYFE